MHQLNGVKSLYSIYLGLFSLVMATPELWNHARESYLPASAPPDGLLTIAGPRKRARFPLSASDGSDRCKIGKAQAMSFMLDANNDSDPSGESVGTSACEMVNSGCGVTKPVGNAQTNQPLRVSEVITPAPNYPTTCPMQGQPVISQETYHQLTCPEDFSYPGGLGDWFPSSRFDFLNGISAAQTAHAKEQISSFSSIARENTAVNSSPQSQHQIDVLYSRSSVLSCAQAPDTFAINQLPHQGCERSHYTPEQDSQLDVSSWVHSSKADQLEDRNAGLNSQVSVPSDSYNSRCEFILKPHKDHYPSQKDVLDKPQNELVDMSHHSTDNSRRSFLLELEPPRMDMNGAGYPHLTHISKTLLQQYVFPFKQAIDLIYPEDMHSLQNSEKTVFEGIPVSLSLAWTGEVWIPVIRVLRDNGALIAPSLLVDSLEYLIKRMLAHNELFLLQFKNSARLKRASSQELLDWLRLELFDPVPESQPIIGASRGIIRRYDRSAFEPVAQKWLIPYLACVKASHASRETSMALIGTWYKNMNPDWWHKEFGVDEEFWKLMFESMTLRKKISSQTVELVSLEIPPAKPRWVGNFQLFNIKTLSRFLPHNVSKISVQPEDCEKVEELHESIIGILASNLSECILPRGYRRKHFSDLWVVLAELEDKGHGQAYSIRLTDAFRKPLTFSIVEKRMLLLLERLKTYHFMFIKFAKKNNPEAFLITHMDLLNWLKKECFMSHNSLPITGIREGNIDTIEENMFKDFQAYLINQLTKNCTPNKREEAAMSILGYWYKNYQRSFWEEILVDDMGYWIFLGDSARDYV